MNKIRNKKIVMKKVLVIFILTSIISCITSNRYIYAAAPYVYFRGRHYLEGGVGKYGYGTRYYWISSKFSGYLYNCAKDAMLDWSKNSKMIDCKYASKKSESVLNMYCINDGEDSGINAYTIHKRGVLSFVNPDEKNWKYGQIYYNLDNGLSTSNLKDRKKIISVFAHEIGHCFGLNENNTNSKSIMCQAGYGRRVTSVQSCDFAGVHRLYK